MKLINKTNYPYALLIEQNRYLIVSTCGTKSTGWVVNLHRPIELEYTDSMWSAFTENGDTVTEESIRKVKAGYISFPLLKLPETWSDLSKLYPELFI